MFSQGKIGSLDHPMMDLNEGPVHCCGGGGWGGVLVANQWRKGMCIHMYAIYQHTKYIRIK